MSVAVEEDVTAEQETAVKVVERTAADVSLPETQDVLLEVIDPTSGKQDGEGSSEVNEWKDVGKSNRASPRRETQKVPDRDARTGSPSRYQVLDEMEEGELESSSSDETEEESPDPPQKEEKAIAQAAGKVKTNARNKPGTSQQGQNEKKKSTKTTKNKTASNRRH